MVHTQSGVWLVDISPPLIAAEHVDLFLSKLLVRTRGEQGCHLCSIDVCEVTTWGSPASVTSCPEVQCTVASSCLRLFALLERMLLRGQRPEEAAPPVLAAMPLSPHQNSF